MAGLPKHEWDTACPICGTGPVQQVLLAGSSMLRVRCVRCGTFEISRTLRDGLMGGARDESAPLLPYLSAFTRQKALRGEVAQLTSANWEARARSHQTPLNTSCKNPWNT